MHVICFDEEESGPLKYPSDKFEMRFENPGIFEYKCSIYTRIKGKVEVVENKQRSSFKEIAKIPLPQQLKETL
jgi:hypothetical protein